MVFYRAKTPHLDASNGIFEDLQRLHKVPFLVVSYIVIRLCEFRNLEVHLKVQTTFRVQCKRH